MFHQLKFSQEELPYKRGMRLSLLETPTERSLILTNKNFPQVFIYKFGETLNSLELKSNHTVSSRYERVSTKVNFPYFFRKDSANPNSPMLLIDKDNSGLSIYELSTSASGFKKVGSDAQFGDIFKWNEKDVILKFGQIFNKPGMLGVVCGRAKDPKKLRFYGLFLDKLTGKNPFKILDFFLDLKDRKWENVYIFDTDDDREEDVIVRSNSDIEIFKFDSNFDLQKMLQFDLPFEPNEELYFENIRETESPFLLHLNSTGLFTYQLNDSSINFLTYTDITSRGQSGVSLQFADLDFDGVKEVLLSGDKGLSYIKYDIVSSDSGLTWIHYDFRNIEIGLKYGMEMIKILHLENDEKNLFFVTGNNNTLKWGEIEDSELAAGTGQIGGGEIIFNEPLEESKSIPKIEESNLLNEKKSGFPIWSLGEELFQDFSIFDMTTGKIKFSLPLWEMSNPMGNLVLIYDGGQSSGGLKSNLLGQGWSTPESFIHMEDGGSVFEIDHKYFIILSSTMYLPLKIMEANSTSEVKIFNIEKKPEIIFKYLKGDERWEMENRSDSILVQIFGGNGGIKKKIGWENWRGSGTSDVSKIQITTDWYLSSLVGKDRNRLEFEYMEDEIEYFRDKLYLKNIKDSDGNSVELFYQNKLDGEYIQRVSEWDENGIQRKSSRKYLSQVNIQTEDFIGNLTFQYEIKPEEKLRILRSINSDGREILKFSYSEVGNEFVMSQIDHVYNGLSLKIGYEEDGKINEVTDRIGRKFNVGKNYRVDYGNDFVLLSYLNSEDRLISKMFNNEMSEEIYSSDMDSDTLKRFPILGRGKIENYVINITGPYIIVMMNYLQSLEICFLKKIEVNWGFEACFSEFGKNDLVKFGNGYLVILKEGENDQLHSIEWNDQKVERSIINFVNNQQLVTFEVSGNKMLVYIDDQLILFVKKESGNWEKSMISGAPKGILRQNQVFLNKFQLKKEIFDKYLNYLRLQMTLKFEQNLVLLSGLEMRGLKSYTRVHSLVLGTSYEVKKKEEFLIEQADFETYLNEIQLSDGKSSIVVSYKEDSKGKFEFRVDEIKGELNEYINQVEKLGREKRVEITKEILKNFKNNLPVNMPDEEYRIFPKVFDLDEDSKAKIGFDRNYGRIEWKVIWFSGKLEDDLQKVEKDGRERRSEIVKQNLDNFKNESFLLLFNQYLLEISESKFKVNETNYTWNGQDWIASKTIKTTTKESFDYQLGEYMTIAKNNEGDSIKIYKQGNDWKKIGPPQVDLGAKYLNQTLVKYPNYLATQNSGRVRIFEFGANNLVERKEYQLEVVESISQFTGDNVLVTEEDDGEHDRIITFRHIGLRSILPNPIIKRLILELREQKSERKLGFEFNDRIIDYLEPKAIYYQKVVKIPGDSKSQHGWIEYSRDGSIQYFDNSGNIVKTVQKEDKKDDKSYQEKDIEEFLNSDEMKLFDKNKRLEIATFFPYKVKDDDASFYGFEEYEHNQKWVFNENHLKMGFSFTGSRYLSLKSGQTLNGEFKPKNQNLSFVVSSWIRMDKNIRLGEICPSMMMTVLDGDKLLATVLSNVKYTMDDWFYVEAFVRIGKNEGDQSQISLRVDFAASGNATLDIDHVRFSPVNADFQANVFNPLNKNLDCIISNTGMIKRYFYDEYKRRIALLGENGQLQFYETFHGKKERMRIDVEFGFYESFSENSFKMKRFEPNNSENFRISQNKLIHKNKGTSNVTFRPGFSMESFGLKFHIKIITKNAGLKCTFFEVINLDEDRIRIKSGKEAYDIRSKYPEVIFVHENGRILIWAEGKLVIDRTFQNEDSSKVMKEMVLQFSEEIELSNCFCFHNPRVSIFYSNGQNQLIQELSLNGANSIRITETLYDALGREAIKTTPIILKVSPHTNLMGYRSNFLTNGAQNSNNSVWDTGKIFGEVSNATDQYSFTRTKFCQDPLNRACEKGLPGEEFAISKTFSRKYSYETNLLFILNLYPMEKGFNYKIDDLEAGIKKMTVTDMYENKMASYTHIPGHEDSLATYKYNEKNKLTQILPPKYHHEAGTFFKLNEELQNPTDADIALQNELGTNIKYDEFDRLSWKKTPDAGPIEFIYKKELLKYAIFYDDKNLTQIKDVIFYEYDIFGQVSTAGNLVNPREIGRLESYDRVNYQNFISNEFNEEPFLRGRMSTFITHNNERNNSLHEEWVMNENDDVISKRVVTRNGDHLEMVSVEKEYSNSGQVKSIEYPIKFNGYPFRLQYTFNKEGEISTIGFADSSILFAVYEYDKFGRLESELLNPAQESNFTRKFNYNAPGFLTRIEDKWLREDIHYTENGYGEKIGYEDGTITSTKFEAKWHQFANHKAIQLNTGSFTGRSMSFEESRTCFEKLQKLGYICKNGHQKRILYQREVNQLPIECSMGTRGKYISKLLGEFGFPEKYGHKYAYGNQRELVQAKYFLDNLDDLPLMAHSFESIRGVGRNASIDIWNILKNGKYINVDGKVGTQLLYNNDKLRNDLSVEPQLISQVGATLINNYVRGSSISRGTFEEIYKNWKNGSLNFNNFGRIWDKLTSSGIISDPVSKDLKNLLSGRPIKEIIKILTIHFNKEIGEAEFDLESFEIDQNGNHKKYYMGPSRYELKYEKKSNRVEKIIYKGAMESVNSVEYEVVHDQRGNIIKALHKGISSIIYHPVSNRPIKIILISGDYFQYSYDNQGERISKKRYNSHGDLMNEISYFRDELGRSLVEKEKKYFSKYLPPIETNTVYIYGARGLIGFYRNNEYFNVITDHEYSTRLVVKDGEVVSAYDYLPYGFHMRRFVQGSSNDLMRYQFTGQEWDEELGLFWFHTRFYDPCIGRFYQIDPKEQYFSPYMYAGNSPVSYIDPDGELAFLITCIVLGIVGAYLGGASANENWNPLDWKFGEKKTWIGIFAGGITGVLLPYGFVGLSAFGVKVSVGLGLGVSYLSAAQGQGSWDPTKWDLKNPGLYNSLFQGFASGSGFITGAKDTLTTFAKFSTKWKIASGFAFAGLAIVNGYAHNWDFKKAGIYIGILNNVNTYTDVTSLTRGVFKGIGKFASGSGKIVKFFQNGKSGLENFKSLMRSMDSKLSFKKFFSGNFFKNTGLNNYFKGSIWKGELAKISGITIMTFSTAVTAMEADENGNPWTTFDAVLNGLLAAKQVSSAARGIIKKGKLAAKEKKKKRYGCILDGKKRRRKRCQATKDIDNEFKNKELNEDFDDIFEKREMAKEILEMYTTYLNDRGINKAPNSAITLAFGDGHVYAAASGNKQKGFLYHKDFRPDFDFDPVAYFGKDKVLEFENSGGRFKVLEKNKDAQGTYDGKPIVFHNNEAKNSEIGTVLRTVAEKFKKCGGSVCNPVLGSAMVPIKNFIDPDIIGKYIPDDYQYTNDVMTRLVDIKKEFEKSILTPFKNGEKLNSKYASNIDKIGIPEFLVNEIKNLDQSRIELRDKLKGDLSQKVKGEIEVNIQKYTEKRNILKERLDLYNDDIRKPFETFQNEIEAYNQKTFQPKWPCDNCAEGRAMAAIFHEQGVSYDNLQIYTFSIKRGLEPFETCLHCFYRTKYSHVKTNVDMEKWNAFLETKGQSSKTIGESSKTIGERKKRSPTSYTLSYAVDKPSIISRIGRGLQSILHYGHHYGHLASAHHKSSQNETKSVNLSPFSHFEGNGTLFLFDVILRNLTGQKFADSPLVDQVGDMEIQGKSLEIIEKLEDYLREEFPGFEPNEYLDLGEINSIIFRGLTIGKGPRKVAKLILDQLKNSPFEDITLLEILHLIN